MLDEGLLQSEGGRDALQARVDGLKSKVANIVDQAPPTMMLDKGAIKSKVQDVIDRLQREAADAEDIASAKKVWDNFENNPLWKDLPGVPVKMAQEAKQGIYKNLGEKSYGQNLMPAAQRDAKKALARSLKEGIEGFLPDIAPLNAETQKLLTTLKISERRLLQHANNNLMGLSVLAHNPAGMIAFLADKSDLFKSAIAQMLRGGSQAAPTMMPAAGIAIGSQAQPPPFPQQ